MQREEMARKLREWARGTVSAEEIFAWASDLWSSTDGESYEDWENDENSVTNEVLTALDSLDINLIVADDVPIYLEFLETPIGQFDAGYRRFGEKLKEIDYAARTIALARTFPYARALLGHSQSVSPE